MGEEIKIAQKSEAESEFSRCSKVRIFDLNFDFFQNLTPYATPYRRPTRRGTLHLFWAFIPSFSAPLLKKDSIVDTISAMEFCFIFVYAFRPGMRIAIEVLTEE